MANRPVFVANNNQFYQHFLDFTWHTGLSTAQKQKSVAELHTVFNSIYPDLKVLEVSSKSTEELGRNLSAFSLQNEDGFLVETIFQGSKVFTEGGPYVDLYEETPIKAKRDKRLTSSGSLIGFNYKGIEFPINPETLFYDWLYIKALVVNKELAEEVLKYSAFTDIEFNPKKSLNCQAQALSIYVALVGAGLLEQALSSVDSFREIVYI
ncbi:DarT1-associated NADAR antitoxin family protein [Lysinibacillus xylanilyticus]|uniref:DarT1-associated NADAR antitoxin family protein n=1 Tax=Lysinibacillus xylanilyticus TaxID=582475 RepID=UPI0036D8028E